MDSLLFGVGATDPLTFTTMPVVLALIACWRATCPRGAQRVSIQRSHSGATGIALQEVRRTGEQAITRSGNQETRKIRISLVKRSP